MDGAEDSGVRERKALLRAYGVYLDQDGRLYDLYYHPLPSSTAKTATRASVSTSSPMASRRANFEMQQDSRKSALLQRLLEDAFDPTARTASTPLVAATENVYLPL